MENDNKANADVPLLPMAMPEAGGNGSMNVASAKTESEGYPPRPPPLDGVPVSLATGAYARPSVGAGGGVMPRRSSSFSNIEAVQR